MRAEHSDVQFLYHMLADEMPRLPTMVRPSITVEADDGSESRARVMVNHGKRK